jgi:hypothetical protein
LIGLVVVFVPVLLLCLHAVLLRGRRSRLAAVQDVGTAR